MPELTIGMAHHTDFHGVWFTIQSLRMHHAEAIRRCELVVVDNSPGTADSRELVKLCQLAGAKLTIHDGPGGTSATRNQIFDLATGRNVMVLDCHVLLEQGALARTLDWLAVQPQPRIAHGPLRAEDLSRWLTHFDDVWRGGMWGTWGSAWRCCETVICPAQSPDGPEQWCEWRLLDSQEPSAACPDCGRDLPTVRWTGHRAALMAAGMRPVGESTQDDPFRIPGSGLGLFVCDREAWPRFHEEHRGFGGEELWIHAKARALGIDTVCLPWLQWCHRFLRPAGAPYPVSRVQTARNYVIEFRSLGWDIEPVRRHFVGSGAIDEQDWAEVAA